MKCMMFLINGPAIGMSSAVC